MFYSNAYFSCVYCILISLLWTSSSTCEPIIPNDVLARTSVFKVSELGHTQGFHPNNNFWLRSNSISDPWSHPLQKNHGSFVACFLWCPKFLGPAWLKGGHPHCHTQKTTVGCWKHLEEIPTVMLTFVQETFVLATFVHIRNISALTDPILMKL